MIGPAQGNAVRVRAFLEHYPVPGDAPHRVWIDPLPFRIGRNVNAHYVIYSRQVSKDHSEIDWYQGTYRIRDLGSTNGTFVNGQRVQEGTLVNGDIIHVAHKELRFGCEGTIGPVELDRGFTEPAASRLPASIIRGSHHLREMLLDHSVRIVFQPIVDLENRRVVAFEALGRGTHSQLSSNPTELFGLAAQCKLAADLSRLLRTVAMEEAARLPDAVRIFINLHPAEMCKPELLDSLRELKRAFRRNHQIVVEVSEEVVAELCILRQFREHLHEMEIGLAYDDFGAGRARLAELAEIPPDYIKLDRVLVAGIDRSHSRQELVQALNVVAQDLGVLCIAEGVETASEARTCKALGCRWAQGFLFGRPQPLALFTTDYLAEILTPLPGGG